MLILGVNSGIGNAPFYACMKFILMQINKQVGVAQQASARYLISASQLEKRIKSGNLMGENLLSSIARYIPVE